MSLRPPEFDAERLEEYVTGPEPGERVRRLQCFKLRRRLTQRCGGPDEAALSLQGRAPVQHQLGDEREQHHDQRRHGCPRWS